jgi:hypothetical protein
MGARVLCLCALATACWAGAASAAGPKSIFDDDWVPPKTSDDARASTARKPPSPPHLASRLAAADDHASAARVAAAALRWAAGSPAQRAEVQVRQRELSLARDAADRAARRLGRLTAAPDDAAANLEVGRHLCFYKNDWRSGLPALARGGDAALKAAARLDLSNPSTGEQRAKVGDAWWDATCRSNSPRRPRSRSARSARGCCWRTSTSGRAAWSPPSEQEIATVMLR